jgi:lipid-binding SYLF domain-containing protein
MNRKILISGLAMLLAQPVFLLAYDRETQGAAERRLERATSVFGEVMAAPDKSIPQDLLDKAHCVVIVPGLIKGAFVAGGEFGRGFISCRLKSDGWSAPAAIRVEGGSFGLQIGGSETDVVMLVMNDKGADRLLGDKFTLGAEGQVAAGPVGRDATAQTDARMTAEILSWSRTRGVFAGLALKGATLRPDLDENQSLYGKRLTSREVVNGEPTPTPAARRLIAELHRYSPRHNAPSGEQF